MTEPTTKRRWFEPRPNWVLLPLLVVEGFLLLSERVGRFGFNEDRIKTWAIALAAILVSMCLALLWIVARQCFRRRFQFSLRTLLVVVTLCAIPCSWRGWSMRQAERQRQAVAAIEKFGGRAECDPQSKGPKWLRKLLGNDIFEEVYIVDFSGTEATDAALEPLKGLNRLFALHLEGTKVTDAGLEQLNGFSSLVYLHLNKTQVTDAGVKKFQQRFPECAIYR
jgi:hypothetical protein